MREDIVVIGSGPAGLALAAALSRHGLKTRLISAVAPYIPWAPTYGIWVDELDRMNWLPGLTDTLGDQWEQVNVMTDGRRFDLARPYALFDNARLQALLWQTAQKNGVDWEVATIRGIVEHPSEIEYRAAKGVKGEARLLIDATGHQTRFIERAVSARLAYQSAYGIVADMSTAPPMASSEMRLMDFTTAHLCPDERSGPPTFLYAMTLKDGRYFLEETSLAAAPGMKQRVLEDRLAQRMAYHGWRARRVLHTERVHFPMNLPLPALDQPFLAYGAAASLVHPASGYQVGAALRLAPYVAQAVVDALNAPGASPKTAAAAGYQAIWPAQRLRKRALYAFGLRRLMSFNAPTTQAFFEAFFALPQPLWAGYLSDSLSLSQILQVMTQVFRHAPAELKRRLLVGR